MKEPDLQRLREASLLLDLAIMNHLEATGETQNLKSAEGTIRLEFGNFWYRKDHPATPPNAPEIESVVVYSSIFSASRVVYFDTLNDAMETIRGWYEYAKAKKEAVLLDRPDADPELP